MGCCGHWKKISGFLLTLTRANIYLNFLAHFILPCADAFFLHFTFPSFTNSCCIICRSPSRGKTFFGIAVLHADAIVLLLLMLLLFFFFFFKGGKGVSYFPANRGLFFPGIRRAGNDPKGWSHWNNTQGKIDYNCLYYTTNREKKKTTLPRTARLFGDVLI